MGSPQSVYSVFHLTIHPWRILQLFCPILGPLCLHFDFPSSSPLHDEDLHPQDLLTRKPHDIAPTTWGISRPLPFLRTLAPSQEPSFKTLSWEPRETQSKQNGLSPDLLWGQLFEPRACCGGQIWKLIKGQWTPYTIPTNLYLDALN